jgi:hydrogenase/urease accessory protein HupE
MNTGFGPFYDGLLHLFVTPEDLLPVVALALLGGLGGPRLGRTVLLVLPAVWLVGVVAGLLLAVPLGSTIMTAAVTVLLGVLVAVGRTLPVGVIAVLAIGLGLLHGSQNGIELATARASATSALGVATALFVVVALLAGQVVTLRTGWTRVVVQVAGSWIAAIGLLMLGWSARGA